MLPTMFRCDRRWFAGVMGLAVSALLLASCSSSPAPSPRRAPSHGNHLSTHARRGSSSGRAGQPGSITLSSSGMAVIDAQIGVLDGYMTKAQAGLASAAGSSSSASRQAASTLGVSAGMSTAAAQGQLVAQVSKRQAEISALLAAVAASASVTAPDRALLRSELSADAAGLREIAARAQSATSTGSLVSLANDVVSYYRVLSLVVPKVYLTLAADQAVYLETALARTTAQGALEARAPQVVSKLSATVRRRAAADASAAGTETAAATTSTEGISASVLSLIPAGYPGNKVVLQSGVNDLSSVLHDIGLVRNDVAALVRLLG